MDLPICLPSDINYLVLFYVTKPGYEFADWVGKLPRFTASEITIGNILKNPRVVSRTIWRKIYKEINGLIDTQMIIFYLISNPAPEAVKIIMGFDNWVGILGSHITQMVEANNYYIIQTLLANPHSTPIIDKLFEKYPGLIRNTEIQRLIPSSPPGINQIMKYQNDYNSFFPIDRLLANPSNKVIQKFIVRPNASKFVLPLLENTNTIALEVGKTRIFDYLNLSSNKNNRYCFFRDRKLQNVLEILMRNPNPLATTILNNILDTFIDSSGEFPDNYLTYFFTCSDFFTNPSDRFIGLIEKYHQDPKYIGQIRRGLVHMVTNLNPKAIKFLIENYQDVIYENLDIFASNPSGIFFCKSNIELFGKCQTLYSNPGIFVHVSDRKLVSKVERELGL